MGFRRLIISFVVTVSILTKNIVEDKKYLFPSKGGNKR